MKRKFLLWYNTYPNWHFFRIMLISIICGIIAMLIALFVLNSKSVNEIKPGQSWVFEYKINNPFEKGYRDTIYIVDVKEDYVIKVNA